MNITMHASSFRVCVLAGLAISACAAPSFAQCTPAWHATSGAGGDPEPAVYTSVVWDRDGEGPILPVLVVGGVFTTMGEVSAGYIATWDGSRWGTLGAGLDGPVDSLSVLHDGTLVASGAFTSSGATTLNRIARWTGAAWQPLGSGMNNEVLATAVLPGGDLVAAGMFSSAGGTPVSRIARWNGASWSAMGVMNNTVWTLLVTPGGDLIAGGQFTYTASVPGNKVARYNGSAWTGMGTVNNTVLSLGLSPEGDVLAGGLFTVPGSRVARWTGSAWAPMGAGMLGPVWAFRTTLDGSLVAGGTFVYADGQACNGIARWTGSLWTPMGTGVGMQTPNVLTIAQMQSGDLYAGGGFTTVEGLTSPGLARWSSDPAPEITSGPVSLTACPRGPASFTVAASPDTENYRWEASLDGSAWLSLADGPLVHGGLTVATAGGTTTQTVSLTDMGHLPSVTPELLLRCVASNSCGESTSAPASLWICPADFDCSGFADTDDFDAFVRAFEAGTDDADFDLSGFVDTDDFDAFVRAFEAGC